MYMLRPFAGISLGLTSGALLWLQRMSEWILNPRTANTATHLINALVLHDNKVPQGAAAPVHTGDHCRLAEVLVPLGIGHQVCDCAAAVALEHLSQAHAAGLRCEFQRAAVLNAEEKGGVWQAQHARRRMGKAQLL